MIVYNLATGNRLDISPFLSDSVLNSVNVSDDELVKYQLNDSSYFIYVKDSKIDTIIRIQLESFDESINFILSLPIYDGD